MHLSFECSFSLDIHNLHFMLLTLHHLDFISVVTFNITIFSDNVKTELFFCLKSHLMYLLFLPHCKFLSEILHYSLFIYILKKPHSPTNQPTLTKISHKKTTLLSTKPNVQNSFTDANYRLCEQINELSNE